MNYICQPDSNYEVSETEKGIEIKGVKNFHPKHIFECGQCFRWIKEEEGKYTGVAGGRVARIWLKNPGTLVIENASLQDFYDFWYHYLDLGSNYDEIKKLVSKDDIMKKAVEFGWGIRILRQEFTETLFSFIISANNMIPRIMKTVETLARCYSQPLEFEGRIFFSFPDLEVLAKLSEEEISVCRAGFRCRYIYETARTLYELLKQNKDHVFSREELLKFKGVGPKVADCILLFSGIRFDVFPVDVWVKRVMEELYFGREASFREIEDFSRNYFGPLAGYAQQYLFYYARENKIGVKK